MTVQRPVLVATEADDTTADAVIAELNTRGVPVVRFDPADIGEDLTVSARFGSSPGCAAGQIRTPSRNADIGEARSLYWRRPRWPAFDQLDPADARFASSQVRHGLGGILYSLPGCLFVNHPLRNHAAEHKPTQLAVAQRMGFTVPPTLVSNDPDAVRAFLAEQGEAVYKVLCWTPYRQGEVGMSVWTEPVTAEEIDDSVRAAPHLFQARVDKIADLRVVVVGQRVFAVRIDSDLLDWRRDYSALSYKVVDLPDRMQRALIEYLAHFGLCSGSFDLCLDRQDDLHWPELNSNGQWGWLEAETGLPVAAAFADLLERGEKS